MVADPFSLVAIFLSSGVTQHASQLYTCSQTLTCIPNLVSSWQRPSGWNVMLISISQQLCIAQLVKFAYQYQCNCRSLQHHCVLAVSSPRSSIASLLINRPTTSSLLVTSQSGLSPSCATASRSPQMRADCWKCLRMKQDDSSGTALWAASTRRCLTHYWQPSWGRSGHLTVAS